MSTESNETSAADAPATATTDFRLTALVQGHVQGVGFRWWTRSRALELGLVGWAKNLPDGRVEVVAEGPQTRCIRLLARLRGPDTPGRVDLVVEKLEPATGIEHTGGKTRFVEK